MSFIQGLFAAWAPMPPLCHIALASLAHCKGAQLGRPRDRSVKLARPSVGGEGQDTNGLERARKHLKLAIDAREALGVSARCPARPRRLPRPPLEHLHHLFYLTRRPESPPPFSPLFFTHPQHSHVSFDLCLPIEPAHSLFSRFLYSSLFYYSFLFHHAFYFSLLSPQLLHFPALPSSE